MFNMRRFVAIREESVRALCINPGEGQLLFSFSSMHRLNFCFDAVAVLFVFIALLKFCHYVGTRFVRALFGVLEAEIAML